MAALPWDCLRTGGEPHSDCSLPSPNPWFTGMEFVVVFLFTFSLFFGSFWEMENVCGMCACGARMRASVARGGGTETGRRTNSVCL